VRSLFPDENYWPDGFTYRPGFLSLEQEKVLMDHIRELDLSTFVFQGFEAKRKVISFGYDYSFDRRSLSKGREIPDYFKPLISRVAKEARASEDAFAELLVTEYPRGAVINWHRDAPPFELIAGISLLSDCTFKFRPYDKLKRSRGAVISIPTARRSLYIIEGEARSAWEHSIAPVANVRFSITLRTLKAN
jgi:alkylated DNA repair dioxygenase AlkB